MGPVSLDRFLIVSHKLWYHPERVADIWKSDNRRNFLDHVQNDLDLSSCRRTCSMDEAYAYLFGLIESDVEHVNFI